MIFYLVPTQQNLPWYRFATTLSNVQYTLRLRFNTRSQRWIMDIADAANTDILTGLPVLLGRDVNGQYVLAALPPGKFFATDDTGQAEQPTLQSFGLSHSLFYADPTA